MISCLNEINWSSFQFFQNKKISDKSADQRFELRAVSDKISLN